MASDIDGMVEYLIHQSYFHFIFFLSLGYILYLAGLHKDTASDIDGMVSDLDRQIAKRAKYSRRRTHDDEEGVNYINERNMRFNKKLERFYGDYTEEIKQNLERGTAV